MASDQPVRGLKSRRLQPLARKQYLSAQVPGLQVGADDTGPGQPSAEAFGTDDGVGDTTMIDDYSDIYSASDRDSASPHQDLEVLPDVLVLGIEGYDDENDEDLPPESATESDIDEGTMFLRSVVAD